MSVIECFLMLYWVLGSLIGLVLQANWRAPNKLLIPVFFGFLTSSWIWLSLLSRGNPSGIWAWVIILIPGVIAFSVTLFWFDIGLQSRKNASVRDFGDNTPTLPKVIQEVRRDFIIKAGFLSFSLIGALVVSSLLGVQENNLSYLAYLILGVLAVLYLTMGIGFHSLNPRAYNPTKYLLRFDWLGTSRARQLYKRIQEPDVRHAFGLNDDLKKNNG